MSTKLVAFQVVVAVLFSQVFSFAWTAFISIDCGSTAPYVDSSGIQWEPDSKYIAGGENYENATTALSFSKELSTLRFFPDTRAKYCYKLPAVYNRTYYLRASWLYSAYASIAPSAPLFNLAIDATTVLNVSYWDPSLMTTAWVEEFIQVAQTDSISVCLLRNPLSLSDPFISALVMRPSVDWWMSEPLAFQNNYFTGAFRYNYGGDKLLSYPDDPFDRYWYPAPPPTGVYQNTSTNTFVNNTGSYGEVPSIVMQTAITSTGNFTVALNYRGTQFAGYVIFYFAEIDSSANFTSRIFDMHYSQGVQDGTTNILQDCPSRRPFTILETWIQGITIYPHMTVEFSPFPGSALGPLLNAMEVYEVQLIAIGTDSGDAMAIEGIKTAFNLTDWNGDPCLPVSDDWISCDNKIPARVTGLNLTNYNLTESIPNSIANLTSLTTIHLENNKLSGSIPEWLATMPALTGLFLQNNTLSGLIPPGLLGRPNFRFDGNPGLTNVTASPPKRRTTNKGAIIGGVVAGILVLVVVAGLVGFYIYGYRRPSNKFPQRDISSKPLDMARSKAYSLHEITRATNDFQKQIGKGGFGPVYYGKHADGQEVAVKVSDGHSHQGAKEFSNEVALLSSIHHKNLVNLLGYCDEKGHQILVYEFLHEGTLQENLYEGGSAKPSRQPLGWPDRLSIAIDAARGLEYLHNGCLPPIIHRDIKSSNILLSKSMTAKVADFGISRLNSQAEPATHVSTNVKGTLGYLDPEYWTTQQLSHKSDVYSFGVVLLELITGRPPIDSSISPTDPRRVLCDWVRSNLEDNKLDMVLDHALAKTHPNKDSIWRVAELAMQCIEPKPIHRPLMSDVVGDLQLAQTMCRGQNPVSMEFSVESSSNSGYHELDMTETFSGR